MPCPPPGDLPDPGIEPVSAAAAAAAAAVESLQSCLTLGSPVECSPPGSSVHGILQARILESVVIFFPRGSS